jgi:hypothetical protein
VVPGHHAICVSAADMQAFGMQVPMSPKVPCLRAGFV